ncbi:MAG TPA: hypothetical protein VK212_01975 [Lentimicrobium sp.]|nr:hypothetical protein [Lentimicrobium sp.]
MGSMIRPLCAKCGADFEALYLGGGSPGEIRACSVPVICDHCGTIITDNILNPQNVCGKCGNPLVYAGKITNKDTRTCVFTWMLSIDFSDPRFYVLKSNFYRCPKCHTRNLSFATEGCWD